MALNPTSFLPEDDDEQRKLRAWQALAGRLPDGGGAEPPVVELPEQVITADPERIPGANAISPPARMTLDEFPSEPEPAREMPPEPPPLARLAQMRSAEPPLQAAAPARESHSGFGGGMGWALVADALLNRGRGAGGILALGSAGATEDRNLDREMKRAQIDRLRNPMAMRGADPYTLQLRAQSLELQKERLGLNRDALESRNKAAAERGDPNGTQANALRGFYAASGMDTKPLEGLSYDQLKTVRPDISKRYELALSGDRAEAAGEKAESIERAKGGVRDERAAREAQNEALKAGARAQAVLPSQQALKRTPGAPAMPTTDPETGQPVITPAQQLQRAKARQQNVDKYLSQTKDLMDAAVAARKLQATFSKHEGGDLPGIGRWDSFKPDVGDLMSQEDRETREQIGLMRTAYQHAVTGAASAAPEEKRLATLAGQLEGISEEQARTAIDAIAEAARNRLRMSSTGREDVARDVLAKAGLDEWALGASAPQTAVAPPAAADRLEVTDQRRSEVPMVSDELDEDGKQQRKLITPRGRKVSYPLSDAEYDKLLRKGFRPY